MTTATAAVERRADGTVLIRSNHRPGQGPRSIAHLLNERAQTHPERRWMKQRLPDHGPWRQISYGEALQAAACLAQWLLNRGLGVRDAVMVLSANSIEHALITLGCYTAGVPVAPISPAHSLLSTDHAKRRLSAAVVRPRLVFAQSGAAFERAFQTLRAQHPALVFVTADGKGDGAIALADLLATRPKPAAAAAAAAAARESLGPASVAKVLFTSGSTGMPKGVPQTFGVMADVIAGQDKPLATALFWPSAAGLQALAAAPGPRPDRARRCRSSRPSCSNAWPLSMRQPVARRAGWRGRW